MFGKKPKAHVGAPVTMRNPLPHEPDRYADLLSPTEDPARVAPASVRAIGVLMTCAAAKSSAGPERRPVPCPSPSTP